MLHFTFFTNLHHHRTQRGLAEKFNDVADQWNTFRRFKNEAIPLIIDGGYIIWNWNVEVENLMFWILNFDVPDLEI